jgi:hypothetical protein
MPTNPPSKQPTKPTTPPKQKPRLDDEPQMIVRGRVCHIEFTADQPEPMPVRGTKPAKPRW